MIYNWLTVSGGGREGRRLMSKKTDKTAESSPDQAWEFVWKELKRVGISRGDSGPFESGILWGQNANQAIEGLKMFKLPTLAVANVGLLLQAAIRAGEVQFKNG
jgi:hypothetical protein